MESRKFDKDNRLIAICFIALAVIICLTVIIVSFNKGTQVESRVADFGTAYRYVEVHSDNKTVWKFRGTLNVMIDGNTTIIRTKTGKEHIFVNADVLIKQIDKGNDSDSQMSDSDTVSQESKRSSTETSSRIETEVSKTEASKTEVSKTEASKTEVSKVESSVESSKPLEASQVTISVSTSESSTVTSSNSSH